ncbi:MAG: hypothetical protein ACLTG4_09630 [Oscillospiraceae bacterium]
MTPFMAYQEPTLATVVNMSSELRGRCLGSAASESEVGLTPDAEHAGLLVEDVDISSMLMPYLFR